MMKIAFAEQDERFIKSQVENGFYTNATEVVRDAVRRLREQAEQRAKLLAALEQGEQSIAEGRTVSYSPALMQDSIERAKQRAADSEKKMERDVVES
jgi:antitoxin ParD1/3/4